MTPAAADPSSLPPPEEPLRPGLLVLQGQQLDLLADAVFAHQAAHPLAPLEEDVFLVQSNGMAEWLKMRRAERDGLCAAQRIELPARFVWQAYRAVLGPQTVPATSPLDRAPLTWRLMRWLPRLAVEPGFEPVAGFLGAAGAPDALRRLQLAEALADLFDAYPVYRSEWLQDWAAGRDVLDHGVPVPADQRWQPALWRALLATLDAGARAALRPALHARFLKALRDAPAPASLPTRGRRWPRLPRRVVLFGTTHIPQPTVQALVALASHAQVLVALPNPCRYHWADLVEGRELLRAATRRAPTRGGTDRSHLPVGALHAHGHPLLAAWGRQARDFIAQLDALDDARAADGHAPLPRVDLYPEDPPPGGNPRPMLHRIQAAIRDGLPLDEAHATDAGPPPPEDRSIVFQVAHSPQREVEVLHDQLLHLLAHPPGGQPLAPRDIVVMVPDIDTYAPSIRAVFGQHPREHPRHLPYGVADPRGRGEQPLLLALEALLRVRERRWTAAELRSVIAVPAVARAIGLDAASLQPLDRWIEAAVLRWGLDAEHRADLGLAACGGLNSARFAVDRMLLGYAAGALAGPHAGIEPLAEVAGLEAAAAGAFALWIERLQQWRQEAGTPRPPAAWGERLQRLLAEQFQTEGETETALLGTLARALGDWLAACADAGFDEPIELPAVREAWLGAVDAPSVARRFKAGGVTFCTLLPMRAIPFEVVCLLGMNDGDYPRPTRRNDFDLTAVPGQARAGDRSRRHDDRQLMLDALLAARRVFSLSWVGRSVRDDSEQPPSVLVAQLRDHLAALWGPGTVGRLTTVHPLQPFSRRYFEGPAPGPCGEGLYTYALEWRRAHVEAAAGAGASPSRPPAAARPSPAVLDLEALARVLRHPVAAWFERRLGVRFDDLPLPEPDDEPFGADALERWSLLDELLRDEPLLPTAAAEAGAVPATAIAGAAPVERLRGRGRLALGGPGDVQAQALAEDHAAMRQAAEEAARGRAPDRRAIVVDLRVHADRASGLPLPEPAQAPAPATEGAAGVGGAGPLRLQLRDSIEGLFAGAGAGEGAGAGDTAPLAVRWCAARLCAPPSRGKDSDTAELRPRALLPWLLQGLAARAAGEPVNWACIGPGGEVRLPAHPPTVEGGGGPAGGEDAPAPATVDSQALAAQAQADLRRVLAAVAHHLDGDAPWPVPLRAGLAAVEVWRRSVDLARPQRAAAALEAARKAYGPKAWGSGLPAEQDDPHLARLYPDFDALVAAAERVGIALGPDEPSAGDPADGVGLRWLALADRLYGPIAEALANGPVARLFAGAVRPGPGPADEPAGDGGDDDD